MRIYLFRHGKSDKSLQNTLSHNEFELRRPVFEEAINQAREVGNMLAEAIDTETGIDIAYSGKLRSKQTAMAIAQGLGLSDDHIAKYMREEFGLIYLTTEEYWKNCTNAVKNKLTASYADYFLENKPDSQATFSANYIIENMKRVIRHAVERNQFLNLETSLMVSHEPVISLCMSYLTDTSVVELGGDAHELEYAIFDIQYQKTEVSEITLRYRDVHYDVLKKIYE